MKLGLGLYRHMLHQDYYAFAVQTGCTHVVVHLVDYFRGGASNPRNNQPTGGKDQPWGVAGDPDKLWTLQELVSLKREIEASGLKLEAIENLDPAHWHDILLDGAKRALHIENVKTILRRMGEAGIPVLGYNFSIAGVCGRVHGPFARGGAVSVGMDGPVDTPIPNGVVWNMIYDEHADEGVLPTISHDEPGVVSSASLERFSLSPKPPACNWPHIQTTRLCQPCAGSRAWSTSLIFTSVSSTSTPAPVTSSSSALARSAR